MNNQAGSADDSGGEVVARNMLCRRKRDRTVLADRQGNTTMPGSHHSDEKTRTIAPPSMSGLPRSEEPMDDEEKVVANRPDVNMPALLTRDVLGG